jgi:uncharacterized protein YacL
MHKAFLSYRGIPQPKNKRFIKLCELLKAKPFMVNYDIMDIETKEQVTRKFIFGIILIVVSLVLGKIVLIPLILFPGSDVWWYSMLIVYILSWIIFIPGIYLTGLEGYRLVMRKYKEYGRMATAGTVHMLKKPLRKRRKDL